MSFQRIVTRTLPDGSIRKVYPFHISLEGMESITLCRDEEDYGHLEKCFYIACWMCNCLPIIGIAMSNHGHLALLAEAMAVAQKVGELIKKRHSQYISWKYNEKSILGRSDINVQYLDSEWYVRNALAYIPRNALDTGCRIEDYRWSGYRGMFVNGKCPVNCRKVSEMSRREREALFRSHEDLSRVPWLVNTDGFVEPVSACDYQYLESAFNNDPGFFLKVIGLLNPSEMEQILVINGRRRQTDTELLAIIANLAEKWYKRTVPELTPEMKARLIPYLDRNYRTSAAQLARCMQLPRDIVSQLLPKRPQTQ